MRAWQLDTDSYNRTPREQVFGEPVEIRAAATAAQRVRPCGQLLGGLPGREGAWTI